MEHLEFIAIIATGGIVAFWYLQNELAEGGCNRGLLALVGDTIAKEAAVSGRSYRVKPRIARTAHEARTYADKRESDTARRSYSAIGEEDRARRKFRHQDEVRYRVKDRAARYKGRVA